MNIWWQLEYVFFCQAELSFITLKYSNSIQSIIMRTYTNICLEPSLHVTVSRIYKSHLMSEYNSCYSYNSNLFLIVWIYYKYSVFIFFESIIRGHISMVLQKGWRNRDMLQNRLKQFAMVKAQLFSSEPFLNPKFKCYNLSVVKNYFQYYSTWCTFVSCKFNFHEQKSF
jgi:hypothetical protein